MSRYPNAFDTTRTGPLDYESRIGTVTLSQFFNAVYAWMGAGLALTAVVAWWVSLNPKVMQQVFSGPTLIALVIAELVLVWVISAAVNKINATMATLLFLIYAALNGLTLSIIVLVYSNASLASTFVVTAGTFGAVSLYGFVTKRDLTTIGSFLFMALIGLILASVVNIFLRSPALYWLITYAGVLIFVGLTAYDTQRLRAIAVQTADNPALAARMSVYGALVLYLDFINLFLYLLRILGSRRN